MRKIKCNIESVILFVLFVIYLIVLFKITIFRDSNSRVESVNLIPFITIFEYFQSIVNGNKMIAISNILGNIIIFFPLGYMSALLFPKMQKRTRILISVFAFSVVIEVIQYIFACGATDIDDVILNILGGVAGYWIYLLTSRFFKPKKYAIFISSLMIAITCIGFFSFKNYKFLLPIPNNLPIRSERRNEDFNEPFLIDEQSNAVLSIDAAITDDSQNYDTETNTDFSTTSAIDSQSNADKVAWYLILINKFLAKGEPS